MDNDKRFKGNPEFPIEEPQRIVSTTTNATDEIYCIDTGGQDATFSAGMMAIAPNDTKSASVWAGQVFNGVMYGRWTNVGAGAVAIACYRRIPINSES